MKSNIEREPVTSEQLAELIEASDRRITALGHEVDRCLARTIRRDDARKPVQLPLQQPPPSRRWQPRIFGTVTGVDLKAAVSRLTARWWQSGITIAVVALGGYLAISLFSGDVPPVDTSTRVESAPSIAPGPAPDQPLMPAGPGEPVNPPRESVAAIEPVPVAGLTVRLVANSPCWIRAVADGAQTIERTLKVGEAIEVRAKDQSTPATGRRRGSRRLDQRASRCADRGARPGGHAPILATGLPGTDDGGRDVGEGHLSTSHHEIVIAFALNASAGIGKTGLSQRLRGNFESCQSWRRACLW